MKNGSNQTITDTTSLAFLNPLRYRGYVYDDETGLYYLRSRYYDPVTGRFLNADVYADTGSGSPLSTNMFAYCENNMLVKLDAKGNDAAWIQSFNSAHTMGHTSLLLQDKQRGWWYFYWSGTSVQMLFLGKGLSIEKVDLVIESILIMYGRYWGISLDYDANYTATIYFKGDFDNSVNYILNYMNKTGMNQHFMKFNPYISSNDYIWYYFYPYKIVGAKTHTRWGRYARPASRVIIYPYKNPNYNLIINNCMQMSITALLHGRFSKDDEYYKKVLKHLKNFSGPNNAYFQILFFKIMSDYNNAYWGEYFLKLYQNQLNYYGYGINWLKSRLAPLFWFINL